MGGTFINHSGENADVLSVSSIELRSTLPRGTSDILATIDRMLNGQERANDIDDSQSRQLISLFKRILVIFCQKIESTYGESAII